MPRRALTWVRRSVARLIEARLVPESSTPTALSALKVTGTRTSTGPHRLRHRPQPDSRRVTGHRDASRPAVTQRAREGLWPAKPLSRMATARVAERSQRRTPIRAVNPHPKDLSGKTVVLYWNGKPNGDLFLNRIGELLIEKVDNVKVIKAWEVCPSTKRTDPTTEASRTTAKELAGLNPDLIIGAPGD